MPVDVFVDPFTGEQILLRNVLGKYRQITKLAAQAHSRPISNKNVRERAVLHFLEMLDKKLNV